ncbi:MAG: NAD(P)-binding protein [Candidatus Omnitrophica bacterium]|nr:NAD(P)-binding protein [Candidatus Omnitrophota bacterium]
MGSKSVTILGAGLAGLSTAWHLQKAGSSCHVYEKEPEPGGLCRSRNIKGFVFDCDGHLLHFRHKEAFSLVKELLGDNLVQHRRNSWVSHDGRMVRYPFQANLFGLPRPVLRECLAGFISARRDGCLPSRQNFLEWIEGTFGEGIARHFMVPYNTKFWTIPPQQMTAEWLDGFVPQPSMDRVIDGAVHDNRRLLGYNSHFWYPRKGGIGELAAAFSRNVKNIHTGFQVKAIDIRRRRIIFGNGVSRRFDELVSTIPLPELGAMIPDLPEDIERAFGRLRWNSIFNLNLGLRQRNPSAKHWIYFPQEKVSFFRVGFFHNFSEGLVPAGRSSLYVEVSYSRLRPLDKASIHVRIEKDLRKVGLLEEGDAIECRDVNDIRYGYPIYDHHYASARMQILDFLRWHDIIPCGRYGGWRYMSMEDVILEGRDVAHRLIKYPDKTARVIKQSEAGQ